MGGELKTPHHTTLVVKATQVPNSPIMDRPERTHPNFSNFFVPIPCDDRVRLAPANGGVTPALT